MEPFSIIAITNRAQCAQPLPARVAALCRAGVDRVIVREKDLSKRAYCKLVQEILDMLEPEERTKIVVNTFTGGARELGVTRVQLPLAKLAAGAEASATATHVTCAGVEAGVRTAGAEVRTARAEADVRAAGAHAPGAASAHAPRTAASRTASEFSEVGASVHSVSEALLAQELGASYLVAGHIFPTACKPGLKPRGLDFLREVNRATTIPVYALGGIDEKTIAQVRETGVAGACLMSGLMLCPDPAAKVKQLRKCLA